MKIALKVELQPTPKQRVMFLKHAGAARWAYNWGLSRKKESWTKRLAELEAGVSETIATKVPTAIDLHKELVVMKHAPVELGGIPWMSEVSKWAPQEALRNLEVAFKNFFNFDRFGRRKKYPKFKSRKRGVGGFRLGSPTVYKKSIKLPTIGSVRIKPGNHRYIPKGKYPQVSITERTGRWYATIRGLEREELPPNGNPKVGLDLGVVNLATLSDGTVIENPKSFMKAQKKLGKIFRSLKRKKHGSSNCSKAYRKYGRAFARTVNIRHDAIHQATTLITKKYGCVVMENLMVWGMSRKVRGKGRKAKAELNKRILDAGWGLFKVHIAYKSKLYGCELITVPPAHTSQTCSSCGCVDSASRKTQAEFKCVHCGYEINADLNAAKNILVAGSCPETKNACGAGVRRVRRKAIPQSAVKQESAWLFEKFKVWNNYCLSNDLL